MYRITINQLPTFVEELFYDPRIKEYALANAVLTREANKIATMEFTIYPSHPQFNNIELIRSELYIYNDNDILICVVRPISKKRLFNGGCEYQCEEITGVFEHMMTMVQAVKWNNGDFGPLTLTMSNRMDILMGIDGNDHIGYDSPDDFSYRPNMPFTSSFRFVTDSLDADLGTYFAINEIEPRWDVLKKLTLDEYPEGYIVPFYFKRGQHVITPIYHIEYFADNEFKVGFLFSDELPESEQAIDFGKNLEDLFVETSLDDFYTRLWPISDDVNTSTNERSKGASNKWPKTIRTATNRQSWDIGVRGGGWLASRDAVERYGPIDKVEKFDKVTNSNTLYNKGVAMYNERNQTPFAREVTLTAVDLADAGVDISQIEFMTRVKCTSTEHGISDYYVVVKHVINFTNPTRSKIELGATKKLLTDITHENAVRAAKAEFDLDDRVFELEGGNPDA